MADEKIVTSIVANSDFSNLIADVQRVTASLSRLQQEFAGSNRSLAGQIDATNAMFSETMRKTGQFSTHFVSLTSDVEKFGRNLDSGRLKLRDYFRVYQDHTRTTGGLIRDLAKQQVQLQNAVLQPLGRNAQGLMQYNVHIPRGLDLTKNKTSILKQELQIMNKVIQDGGVQLINWGKNTQWAGRQLTVGLTLPLVAFGKAAADAFKVADQELTRLTKVYGDIAGTSAQELGQIRKEVSATAKELSAAMGVNFTETIGLAADIAATGKTGNELLSSVSETTRLAVLGEVDRQEAMKATLAIQSAFKQNTEELAETINFLNAVENQTSTTLNDLVTAIPKAGPVIKGLGGSVQDLALYLTAMREGGINATEGANALKSALASLINPTDVAVKKFQGFGIDLLGIVKKNAGSTTDTLFALQAALDNLNPLQKQQAIEQLFGKFQYSRLNALFENLGKQGSQTLQVLDLMKASAGELEAVAGRELAAVTESAAGRYKRAVETLKAELAGVGDQFLNIGTKLVNVLSKIIEFAQKLPDPIKKIMAFGGAFTAIIGPIIMLTGVLANFFGYIIKGLGHFKALFKGAEGFKLLTPEIMAAKAAGSQLANEFYSDALAADTLRIAIEKLNNDLVLLQKNALGISKPGSTTGQLISTIAGTPLMAVGGGARVTDPNHPLVGTQSRAAAHLNPRDPNNPSSIFGLTLQPIPLNRKIGRTPQVMMTEALPNIEGVTSHQGYSTGVVAGEHARYAALMATLGVQSRQEIEALKKTIALGGQVSSEFIATFDDILPITQRLTQNAATQSASIVAQLRAGQLSAEQARSAIIAVNADLERMMGSEISLYAASRGRTIDLSKAPLINQPVVDASGKPNTRGMFRQGIFSDVMSAVGRATGTRTFGGPYSIETTTPSGLIIQRKNAGGKIKGYIGGGGIYETDGMTVPGPNVNADVVPAMLTPGEFVLTRGTVEREGSDSVEALHRGEATIVPITFNANSGGKVPGVQYRRFGSGILRVGGSASRTRDIFGKGGFGGSSWLTRNPRTASTIESYISQISNPEDKIRAAALIQQFAAGITTGAGSPLGRARYPGVIQPGHITREEVGLSAFLQKNGLPAMQIGLPTHSTHLTRSSVVGSQRYVSRYEVDYDAMSNLEANQGTLLVKNFLARNMSRSRKYDSLFRQVGVPESKWNFVEKEIDRRIQANLAAKGEMRIGDNFGDLTFQDSLIPIIDDVMVNNGADPLAITMIKRNTTKRRIGNNIFGPEIMKMFGFNRGGMVPGYMGGGKISRATLLARLGAKFKFTGKHYSGPQALETYSINAMDMNGGRKYFGDLPISDKARGALYNSTVDFFNSNVIRPDRGAPEQRGFGVRHLATAFPTIASMALNAGKDFLTKDDITLLSSYAGKSGSLRGSMGASLALHRVAKVFRANRGGSVPRYMGGGSVPRYGYARGVQNRFAGGGILKMLAAMGIMQAGMGAGQKMGGAGGQALSTASSFLPFMFMGMGPGMGGGEGPSVQQRLGMSSMMTPNLGAFGRPLTAGSPLATQTLIPQIAGGKQSIFAQGTPMLGKFAGNVERATTSSSGFVRALGKIGLGLTRTNVALGLAAGAAYAGYKAWQNYQEGLDRTRLAAGLNAESAGKLGLKYKSLTSELKASIGIFKAWMATNRAIYEGMMSSNAPFRMTIAEYKKLRKEVKGTMQDQIDLINNTKESDLPQLAVQLKAMFVGAGMSAEEASKKIWMAFTLSNKAAQAGSATIGNRSFNNIKNAASAATASVENFNNVMKKTKDTEAGLNALNSAWMAISGAIDEATKKAEKNAAKNNEDFDETQVRLEEEKRLLDDLSKKNLAPIGEKLLNSMAAANPEILKVGNALDTVVSLMQKMTLMTDFGYAGNLSGFDPTTTAQLYAQAFAINQKVIAANKTGILAGEYKELEDLEKRQKALEKAARGEKVQVQINRRDRIKALQEEIDGINKAADARKKALQEEAEDQDINIEIQKKRLEYQQKIAAGDMAGAAQAQLDLTKLTGQQQRTITERQIEDRRKLDIEPLQSEIDRLNDKTSDMADQAALAADNLENLNKKIFDQQTNIDAFNKSVTAYLLNQENNSGNLDILGAAAIDAAKALGLTKDAIDKYLSPESSVSPVPTGTTTAPHDAAMKGQGPQGFKISPTGIDITGTGTPTKPIPNPPKDLLSQYNRGKGNRPSDVDGTPYITLFFNKKTGEWEIVRGYDNVRKVNPSESISIDNWNSGTRRYAGGGHIRGFSDGTTHGPVEGPGTWTSDSILARLSDGEFVTKSASVHDAGVDNMHLINEKGAAGIVEAAMNLVMKKDGGSIDKFNRGGLAKGPTRAALALLGSMTALFPKRNRASDGIMPSAQHMLQNPASDHNKGLAVDITHDPKSGVDGNKLFRSLRLDPRTSYLIFNRRIWNKSIDAQDSPGRIYRGSNPHSSHLHVSILSGLANAGQAWLGAPHDMAMRSQGVISNKSKPEGISEDTYTVKAGDTLSEIAIRSGTSLSKLIAQNPKLLNSKYQGGSKIFRGTRINIPGFKEGGISKARTHITNWNKEKIPIMPRGIAKPGTEYAIAPEKNYPIDHIKSPMGSIQRFIDIARSQIGSGHNYKIVDKEGTEWDVDANKYTTYVNDLYKLGSDVLYWCGAFIAWASANSGVKISDRMFSAFQSSQEYKKKGMFNDLSKIENLKNVKPGDIAWFDFVKAQTPGVPDHASIVTGKTRDSIRAIGQYGTGRVAERSWNLDELFGSVRPEGFAKGGYVNPSYSSNMSMPSYKTGVKYLYDDTIAQLHKGEAVLPENMNPWNPNSNSPIGGNTYYIQPTINAAPGMDENALANLTAQKVHNIFKEKEVKAGRNRVYSGGGTI